MKANKEKLTYSQKNVLIADIIIPELLLRQNIDHDELEKLIQSIKQVGLINPITLIFTDPKYTLIAGFCRLEAFCQLKRKYIPARIIHTDKKVSDQIMLDENLIRTKVNIVDEAVFFANIIVAKKISQKELAAKIDKSETFVSERLKILDMDDRLLIALKNDEISLAVALVLNKCLNLEDKKNLLNHAIENGATEKIVRSWVDNANLEFKQGKIGLTEGEFIDTGQQEYVPPVFFCDICESKTTFQDSKFIRMCPDCLKITKANLGPKTE